MAISRLALVLSVALVAPVVVAQASQDGGRLAIQREAWQIMQLANQVRAAEGSGPLQWDPALGEAARQHCLRMAAEGPISHRYGGEPDLTERAGQAGAHFSLIEENVAIGPSPAAIHDEWMHSAGHRSNLLNPQVDRIGVAVVASRGVLYSVADYAKAVPVLTPAQVEATIGGQLRSKGITLSSDSADARAYCSQQGAARIPSRPGFRMLWQEADLTHLPQPLLTRIATGQYRQAAVGSCPAQDVEGSFTAYRVAVLLY